ncbi:hypothetical protein BHE74_00005918 [Ensete ventricosum]|nr:hypothetical protein BHE74_00005918 [Ensete ventricosum]
MKCPTNWTRDSSLPWLRPRSEAAFAESKERVSSLGAVEVEPQGWLTNYVVVILEVPNLTSVRRLPISVGLRYGLILLGALAISSHLSSVKILWDLVPRPGSQHGLVLPMCVRSSVSASSRRGALCGPSDDQVSAPNEVSFHYARSDSAMPSQVLL